MGRSRSPQGERGLKPAYAISGTSMLKSLPARGAWVETPICPTRRFPASRRSPQGERGLKLGRRGSAPLPLRRSPQGERGLKQVLIIYTLHVTDVAPRKGSVG